MNDKIKKSRIKYNVQYPATLAIGFFKHNAKTQFNYNVL